MELANLFDGKKVSRLFTNLEQRGIGAVRSVVQKVNIQEKISQMKSLSSREQIEAQLVSDFNRNLIVFVDGINPTCPLPSLIRALRQAICCASLLPQV